MVHEFSFPEISDILRTHSPARGHTRQTLSSLRLYSPFNVQLNRVPRLLENVLRVCVGQFCGVEVFDAHDAVAHVKETLAGGADRHLKQKEERNQVGGSY